MQVPGDEVVGVIAVGDHFMAATRPVLVRGVVRRATMRRGAGVGIRIRDLDHVLVDVALVSVMHMPVVQVIDVPGVRYLRMRTARAVRMIVFFMNRMCHDLSVASTQATRQKYATSSQICLAMGPSVDPSAPSAKQLATAAAAPVCIPTRRVSNRP